LNQINDFQTQLNEPGTQLNGTRSNKRKAPFKQENEPQKVLIKEQIISLNGEKKRPTKPKIRVHRPIAVKSS
jgi:hypothetical protein